MKPLAAFFAGILLTLCVSALCQENRAPKAEAVTSEDAKQVNPCEMVSFPPAEAMKGWSAGEVRKNIVAPQVGYKAFSAFAKGRDWGYDPQNDKASSCLRKFIEAAE